MRKNMRKKLLMLILLVASLQASATNINNKFYVGAEGLVNMYTTYAVLGASVLGGYRWDDLSAEVGFTKLENDDWGQGLNFKSENYFIDGIYTHPLEDNLEVKTSLGVGLFHSRVQSREDSLISMMYSDGEKEISWGLRAGIGIQYIIDDSMTVDLTYKMQTNCTVLIGYMSIYSLGVRYYL